VVFFVSPYLRSVQTFSYVAESFDKDNYIHYEEPRLREQDFGNFQDQETMAQILKERDSYGRFFFRFPNGESGADVYDRISTFLETMYRFFSKETHETVIIVSHGLTIRLFLMRWFHWSVDTFETFVNPRNCEYKVMELRDGAEKYILTTPMKTKDDIQEEKASEKHVLSLSGT